MLSNTGERLRREKRVAFAVRKNYFSATQLMIHEGSVRAASSSGTTANAAYDYDAYGTVGRATQNVSSPYRFTGQPVRRSGSVGGEFDLETNLHNFRARMYDSNLGMFYAADPAHSSSSPYGYVGGNPVTNIDRDGRKTIEIAPPQPDYNRLNDILAAQDLGIGGGGGIDVGFVDASGAFFDVYQLGPSADDLIQQMINKEEAVGAYEYTQAKAGEAILIAQVNAALEAAAYQTSLETSLALGATVGIDPELWTRATVKGATDISPEGTYFIMKWEGYDTWLYYDNYHTKKNPTIGFGHKLLPGENYTEITGDVAVRLFSHDLAIAVNAVKERISKPLSQSQFDALVSFAFNAGGGNLGRKSGIANAINSGNYSSIPSLLNGWTRGGPGNLIRRNDEAIMFQYGVYNYHR